MLVIVRLLYFLFMSVRPPFLYMNPFEEIMINNLKKTNLDMVKSERVEDHINDFESFNRTRNSILKNITLEKNKDCAMIPIQEISLNHETIKTKMNEYLKKRNITKDEIV